MRRITLFNETIWFSSHPICLGWVESFRIEWTNRPISQIPECICTISHNATFCNRNVHTCTHYCYKMLHCGIFVWCIVGFVRWVYSAVRSSHWNSHRLLHSMTVPWCHQFGCATGRRPFGLVVGVGVGVKCIYYLALHTDLDNRGYFGV